MKKILYLLFAVLLILSSAACEDLLLDDTTDSSDSTTGDGSSTTSGTYSDNGFDDQVSYDFAVALLKEVNYARTNPSGYAAERLLSYYNSGTDNGAYLDLKNNYSAMTALTLNTRLNKAADKYAKVMGDNDHFDHYGPDGKSPFERMAAEGYSYSTAGENIAWSGYPNADASSSAENAAIYFMLQWIIDEGYPSNNAGHRINIMKSTFKEIGIGFYTAPGTSYNKHYSVQDFGAP